jgi:hypothetical protein
MNARAKFPKTEYAITRLGGGQTRSGIPYPGGLDLVTPSLSLPPGSLRTAQNYECTQAGGYARIEGYERFDGKFAPSAAGYVIVQFTAFLFKPAVGDVLNQDVSVATGKVVAVRQMPGATYVALTQVLGNFDTTHMVHDGANDVGIPIPALATITGKQNAMYTAAAANVYRALINPVPGSGPILDVFHLVVGNQDKVFAFRANAGGTAVNLYQASTSGWTSVALNNQIAFTASSVLPLQGDTLTQGAVHATILRVVWSTGTTGASSAAGTLVLSNPTGGNFAAGAATSSSGGVLTLSGAQTAITLLPGGVWEHDKYNFSSASGQQKVYGCDGVNKGYEFDGVTYTPIPTGANPDAPKHVVCHKGYLIFSLQGSIIGSAPAQPFKWTATDGAWEIATGGTVTGMVTVPGAQTTATLAVFQAENTAFLYGTDRTTFNYVTFNTGIGALPGSIQNLFDVFVFDSLGVITVQTTLNFGNFASSSLTKNLLPFIIQQRTKISTSCVFHTKGQYRVFFKDGYGLYLTMVNQQYLGAIPVQFPNPVNCIDVSNVSTGAEKIYFGSSDNLGYVYQMDIGTSFDGQPINSYLTLAWDNLRSPRVLKRFRALSIEMQGNGYAEVMLGYNLNWKLPFVAQPLDLTFVSSFALAQNWDQFTWDQFTWDGSTLAPSDMDIGGTAENIQLTIYSSTDFIPTYTINSIIYHYTQRRGVRV